MAPDDTELSSLVDRLDHAVPREESLITLELFRKDTKGGVFIGNKYGYMRFGIEILKGGLSEPPKAGVDCWPIEIDWRYLLARIPMFAIDEFVRDDSLTREKDATNPFALMERVKGQVAAYSIIFVLFLLLSCVGLFNIMRFLVALVFG